MQPIANVALDLNPTSLVFIAAKDKQFEHFGLPVLFKLTSRLVDDKFAFQTQLITNHAVIHGPLGELISVFFVTSKRPNVPAKLVPSSMDAAVIVPIVSDQSYPASIDAIRRWGMQVALAAHRVWLVTAQDLAQPMPDAPIMSGRARCVAIEFIQPPLLTH